MPSGVFICIYGTQIELFKTNIENILSEDFVCVYTRIQVKATLEKRYRPRREIICLRGMRTTKAQTSLRIRADSSAPLLFAF